jgi:hypothetical protein
MAKLTINTGTIANDGTGDTLRSAGGKINDNFSEIYNALGNGTALDTPFSGDYDDLSNKPTLFDGAYSSLSGAPSIPADVSDLTDTTTLLFDGAYSSLSGAPTIPVDLSDLTDTTNLLFDGAYSSLSGAPSIPADTGDLTNNAGFVANSDATLTLAVSTTAPASPATGMFAVADGNTAGWDPAGTNLGIAYPVFYNGSSWTALL